MQISTSTYSRLKSRIKRRYHSQYQKSIRALKHYPQTKTAQWLKTHHSDFSEFSPQRWFFLQQVETLIFFLSQKSVPSKNEMFSETDDEIFEKWNQSEFADVFLKFLNKRMPLHKASLETMKLFDDHLVSLGNLHLLKTPGSTKNYRLQTSLGDYKKQNKISKLLETTLHLEGKELGLLTSSLKEMKNFSTRIEVASKVIRKFSPDSWERFSAFTEVIIPIKQKELVSFSHQELPGTSMINLYHRDFVDLLDDLLHENGHHHLNYYLNLETLIQEPIDCIYYSPWRRTLRPLRGIYHAYFTFFWAFKLFSDMANSKDIDSIWYTFSQKEKEKITWRAVEEFWMLEYTFKDLQWARKQNLISDLGWDLIKEQRNKVIKFKSKIVGWEKTLKAHKKELQELKKTLVHARKHYTKI
ncbi:MAG: hypothetical protein H0V66_06525 [Bdellovibrionales bacterium]|nr:hypothetical protein [Bdellovibrionales bacterium]